MNDCPNGEMRDRLPDLLSGRLAAPERAAVEAHLASCGECRDELALLRQLRVVMHRAPAVDVVAIVRALPAYEAPVARHALRGAFGGWRAAAAVVAIAVGGTSLAIARHGTAPVDTTVAQAPVVTHAPVRAPVAPPIVVATRPAATRPLSPAPTARVAQAGGRGELAMNGAVSDLTDGELAALIDGIGSLDAIPSTEVESPSLAPATSATTSGDET